MKRDDRRKGPPKAVRLTIENSVDRWLRDAETMGKRNLPKASLFLDLGESLRRGKVHWFAYTTVDRLQYTTVDGILQANYLRPYSPRMTLPTRIQEAMRRLNMKSQMALSRRSKVPQPTINRILKGATTTPDIGTVMKLAEALSVSSDWLLTGRLDRRDTQSEALPYNSPEQNVEAAPDLGRRLPVISWVQAGQWTEICDTFSLSDAEEWIPWPGKLSKRAFVLRVVGESMFDPSGRKSYSPGDYIAVEPEQNPVNRSLVVVRINGDNVATFKQLLIDEGGTMMLRAINPSWPKPIFELPADSDIVGVVVGKFVPE